MFKCKSCRISYADGYRAIETRDACIACESENFRGDAPCRVCGRTGTGASGLCWVCDVWQVRANKAAEELHRMAIRWGIARDKCTRIRNEKREGKDANATVDVDALMVRARRLFKSGWDLRVFNARSTSRVVARLDGGEVPGFACPERAQDVALMVWYDAIEDDPTLVWPADVISNDDELAHLFKTNLRGREPSLYLQRQGHVTYFAEAFVRKYVADVRSVTFETHNYYDTSIAVRTHQIIGRDVASDLEDAGMYIDYSKKDGDDTHTVFRVVHVELEDAIRHTLLNLNPNDPRKYAWSPASESRPLDSEESMAELKKLGDEGLCNDKIRKRVRAKRLEELAGDMSRIRKDIGKKDGAKEWEETGKREDPGKRDKEGDIDDCGCSSGSRVHKDGDERWE